MENVGLGCWEAEGGGGGVAGASSMIERLAPGWQAGRLGRAIMCGRNVRFGPILLQAIYVCLCNLRGC